MSRLNWANVAAPDFSTSLAGIRTAGSLLDQAFNRASSTIEGVDGDISSRVNKAVLAQIAGISEADGAEGQIQQLLAGVDPRRLNTATIEFGAGRPDALINREASRFNLATSEYNQERAQERDAALDGTEGLRMQLAEAYRTKDMDSVARISGELSKAPGLRASDFMAAVTGGQNIRSGDLGIQNSELGLQRSQYGFGREKMTDADNDAAGAVLAEIQKLGLFTPEDAAAYVNSKGLSPQAYNAVMRQISPLEFLTPGAGGSGGGMGGGGGGSAAFDGTPEDAVQAFMGKVANVESGGKGGAKNPNSSASGLYQFTEGTFKSTYKKVFGGDDSAAAKAWSTNRFDNSVQEQLMQQLTKDNLSGLQSAGIPITPGSLYLAHFAGIGGAQKLHQNPNASVEAVLGSKVVQANSFLKGKTAGEVIGWADSKMGMSPRGAAAVQAAGAMGRVQRTDSLTGDPVIDNYVGTVGKSNSVIQVASQLTGEGGIFAGVDRKVIEARLRTVSTEARQIAKEAGLDWAPNNDQAALLLENSLGARSYWDGVKQVAGFDDTLDGRSIDRDALKTNVLKIAGGQAEKTLLAQQDLQVVGQQSAQLQAARDQQAAYVQQLMNKPGTNPRILARERGKLAMLDQSLTDDVGQQVVNGDVVSRVGSDAKPVTISRPKPLPKARPAAKPQPTQRTINDVLTSRAGTYQNKPGRVTIADMVSDTFSNLFD